MYQADARQKLTALQWKELFPALIASLPPQYKGVMEVWKFLVAVAKFRTCSESTAVARTWYLSNTTAS